MDLGSLVCGRAWGIQSQKKKIAQMRASPRFQFPVTASPTHPGAITLGSIFHDLHPLSFTATFLLEHPCASGTELTHRAYCLRRHLRSSNGPLHKHNIIRPLPTKSGSQETLLPEQCLHLTIGYCKVVLPTLTTPSLALPYYTTL